MADHDVLLRVQELRKSYPNGYQAVKGLDFEIRRGEIFGFLGPNGAGKTTTISMLSGLQPPTSGQIIFDGLDATSKRHLAQVKSQIGLVPQELALYPTLSAYDNLTFFGRIYRLRGKTLKRRVQKTLEMVGLADRAHDAVQTFSGGMKRRINIAAALLHEPQILFLDEPTVGVDPQSRNAIFEGIEQLNRDGMTILYTTHYMEEAQRLCDRVAIVDKGQIVACDTTTALIRSIGEGVIQLGMNDEQAAALAAQANQLAAIKEMVYENGVLLVEVHQIQQALMSLLERSSRLQIPMTSLKILEPNLETVFLRLTGKSLRD